MDFARIARIEGWAALGLGGPATHGSVVHLSWLMLIASLALCVNEVV